MFDCLWNAAKDHKIIKMGVQPGSWNADHGMQQQLSEVSGKKEAPKMNCHEGWNDYAPECNKDMYGDVSK